MNVADKRSAVEQILENKENILKHFQRDEVLADFGIRIIGQLATVDELYRVPQEGLEYGDAYAVGTQSPFNYFIWTRANNLSPSDYWFDFGEIAIAGPQGPRGDRGPQGETGQSTRWYLYSDAQWDYPSGKKPGDMALTYPSGNVYIVGDNGIWEGTGNIRGPQGPAGKNGKDGPQGEPGPQGPKGDTGDVGGFINIAGVVSSYEALPDPEVIGDLTVAYLVGTAEPYQLYIQVGSNSRVAEWLDVGPLNVATMVTVNGQYQNTWNADTKVDKIPLSQAGGTIAYTRDHLGNESYRGVSASANGGGGAIPVYNRATGSNDGILKTSMPETDNDCVNRGYADANYGPITIPLDGLTINWNGENYFDVPEEDFVYRLTPYIIANYGQRDELYNIQLEPVILPVYVDMATYAISRGVISPSLATIPEAMELEGLELTFTHSPGDGTEIYMHLNQPQALGHGWDITELELTIIVERLY